MCVCVCVCVCVCMTAYRGGRPDRTLKGREETSVVSVPNGRGM